MDNEKTPTFTSQGHERVNLKNHILWFYFLLIIHTNYMAVYIKTSVRRKCSILFHIFSSFNDFRIVHLHCIDVFVCQDSPEQPPQQQCGQHYSRYPCPSFLFHNLLFLNECIYIPKPLLTRNVHPNLVSSMNKLYFCPL